MTTAAATNGIVTPDRPRAQVMPSYIPEAIKARPVGAAGPTVAHEQPRAANWTNRRSYPHRHGAESDNPQSWTTFAERWPPTSKVGSWSLIRRFLPPGRHRVHVGRRVAGSIATNAGTSRPGRFQIVHWRSCDGSTPTSAPPSRTGLKSLVRGELPPGRRRNDGIEVYDKVRYFTVTGSRLPLTPATVEDRTAELAAVHADVFPPEPKSRLNTHPRCRCRWPTPRLSPRPRPQRRAAFAELFEGGTGKHGPDPKRIPPLPLTSPSTPAGTRLRIESVMKLSGLRPREVDHAQDVPVGASSPRRWPARRSSTSRTATAIPTAARLRRSA